MDFNKLKNDNGIYLYQDDNFNTIYHLLSFVMDRDDKTLAALNILQRYIKKSNIIHTYEEVNNLEKELYALSFNININYVGSKAFLDINLGMISPTIVEEDYSEKVYKYVNDILFNINFNNQELLDRIKREILSDHKIMFSNPDKVAKKLFHQKVIYQNENVAFPTKMSDIEDIYNSITLEDLKEIYEKTLSNNRFYRGLVFGNITDTEFKTFREYFPFKNNNDILDYTINNTIPNETIEIESTSAKETTVYVTYEINKMNQYLNLFLNNVLNRGNMLCHKIIREKYGLAYLAYMDYFYYNNCITFISKIDYKNKDKLLDAINEIIELIQDEEKLNVYLEKAKKDFKDSDYLLSENKDDMIDIIEDRIFGMFDKFDYDELKNNIDNYSVKDIKNYTKKLKRKNIFIYKGVSNE